MSSRSTHGQRKERIQKMPDSTAKTILAALCSNDSSMSERATALLDRIELNEKVREMNSRGLKRKAEWTVKICVQCQDSFYEEENGPRACKYHCGELEPDESGDFWADHDEDCHGPIDTDENRMEFPEGFMWSCCDKLGHRSGCFRGEHSATSDQRGRYGDAPGTAWKDDDPSTEESEEEEDEEDEDDEDDEEEEEDDEDDEWY